METTEQGLVLHEGAADVTTENPLAELKAARQQNNDRKEDGVDVSDLKGLPRGGKLGPGRFLFRPQVFWQQILPEHVVPGQCEFKVGLGEDSRNFARIPNDILGNPGVLPEDSKQLIDAATCVAQGEDDEMEIAKVIRSAAGWGDHIKIRRLLASCFIPSRACSGALCDASLSGHEKVVEELLRAKAAPTSDDGKSKKTALHFACEQGHENVAKMLLGSKADLGCVDATGRTPCELAREQDLGMMAKRLEKSFL
jgi:hypothetical protein